MIGLRFFPLKSADVRGAGTRDEPLRTSAWEASQNGRVGILVQTNSKSVKHSFLVDKKLLSSSTLWTKNWL